MPTWVLVAVYVAGLVAEIAGLLLLSYAYIRYVRLRDLVSLWLSALVRGPQARGAAVSPPEDDRSAGEARQRNLRALQGLALIAVGFLLQAAVTIWTLTHPS